MSRTTPPVANEDALRRGIELLYFAYSHMTRSADARLAEQGLGRAHHRALYFIARSPGIVVGDLLKLLSITKQSLARVLNELIKRDLVLVQAGDADRRQRQLRLSGAGEAFEKQLFDHLKASLELAYRDLDDAALFQFWQTLEAMIPDEDRARIAALRQPHSRLRGFA
jgi:DNA-binding MarR family transcriptional regulator